VKNEMDGSAVRKERSRTPGKEADGRDGVNRSSVKKGEKFLKLA